MSDAPRSFRRNVDEDINKLERATKEREAEARANERMRSLFGGTAKQRGVGGFGRTDLEMESTRERLQGDQRELNKALEYRRQYPDEQPVGSSGRPDLVYKKGGPVKKMASGGVVKSSASSRADGCAARGKTKGRMV